jgi:hypothetical protein
MVAAIGADLGTACHRSDRIGGSGLALARKRVIIVGLLMRTGARTWNNRHTTNSDEF